MFTVINLPVSSPERKIYYFSFRRKIIGVNLQIFLTANYDIVTMIYFSKIFKYKLIIEEKENIVCIVCPTYFQHKVSISLR